MIKYADMREAECDTCGTHKEVAAVAPITVHVCDMTKAAVKKGPSDEETRSRILSERQL